MIHVSCKIGILFYFIHDIYHRCHFVFEVAWQFIFNQCIFIIDAVLANFGAVSLEFNVSGCLVSLTAITMMLWTGRHELFCQWMSFCYLCVVSYCQQHAGDRQCKLLSIFSLDVREIFLFPSLENTVYV